MLVLVSVIGFQEGQYIPIMVVVVLMGVLTIYYHLVKSQQTLSKEEQAVLYRIMVINHSLRKSRRLHKSTWRKCGNMILVVTNAARRRSWSTIFKSNQTHPSNPSAVGEMVKGSDPTPMLSHTHALELQVITETLKRDRIPPPSADARQSVRKIVGLGDEYELMDMTPMEREKGIVMSEWRREVSNQ